MLRYVTGGLSVPCGYLPPWSKRRRSSLKKAGGPPLAVDRNPYCCVACCSSSLAMTSIILEILGANFSSSVTINGLPCTLARRRITAVL